MTGTQTPLVTVVTIFRNPPIPFFEAAIESVVAQTEPRWELVLVDDGSTDDSPTIAMAAAARHPDRIRVVAHPGRANRGMSTSRNLGIGAGHGPFVAFLDADDVFLPEKLERQLEVFARHPDAAIVYGPSLHWWSWTGDPIDGGRDHPRRLGFEPERLIAPPELIAAFLEDRADTPATCAVLIRRSAIDEVGGFEPSFKDLYEDQAFFYKVLLGHVAYLERDAWDRYRRHPDAMCEIRIREGVHADDTRPTVARSRFLSWLEERFTAAGIDDPRLRRALRRERWPYRHPRRYQLSMRLRGLARSILPASARRAGRRLIESGR
jgi:glycosyltransferase involved in cell wall biosynthesis